MNEEDLIANILDAQDYGDLVDALRRDLLLNALTDVLPGSVGASAVNDGLVNNSTSATTGSASALPAAPAGYLTFTDAHGTVRKIPYYNK